MRESHLQSGVLTPELQSVARQALDAFMTAPPDADGRTIAQKHADRDRDRIQIINEYLQPLMEEYFRNEIPLPVFKRKVDGINKQNNLWGFGGIKGQMFFNMLLNGAEAIEGGFERCDAEVRAAIRLPAREEAAADQLRSFRRYVEDLGDRIVSSGESRRATPKPHSIPFFVSYFWQVQQREVWPVFFTSSVQAMSDLNLLEATDDPGTDYLCYKARYDALVQLFSTLTGRQLTLYDVEHVLAFRGGRTMSEAASGDADDAAAPTPGAPALPIDRPSLINDSYVPPIVAVIPQLALNSAEANDAARLAGTSVERALEKSCNAALSILGYETTLLGQGRGRVPDGLAVARDESYALVWDAKARADGYSMGTDDRAIRDYIDTQSRELRRRLGLRNIYYIIISSAFSDDFDELIRSLKMETSINEVCLLEASALVEMVEQRLRSPLTVGLGPDGIQRLFSASAIITPGDVRETLAEG